MQVFNIFISQLSFKHFALQNYITTCGGGVICLLGGGGARSRISVVLPDLKVFAHCKLTTTLTFFHLLKLRGSYTQDMFCLSTAPLLAFTPALEGLPSLFVNGRGDSIVASHELPRHRTTTNDLDCS